MDQITFANLLTHTSGLAYGVDTSASDFLFMKEQIAAGTTHIWGVLVPEHELRSVPHPDPDGQRQRPAVAERPAPLEVPDANDRAWDVATLSDYQTYVQANVFGPSGVTDATLVHEPDDALAYNFPVSGAGWNSGDLTTMAGGAGWHMTIDDVLNVMGTFRRAGTIVSQEQAQTMLDSNFGIDFATFTLLGTLYAKNGGLAR